jgi:hypothetical protein
LQDGRHQRIRADREHQNRCTEKSQLPATHRRNQSFTGRSFPHNHANIAANLSRAIAFSRQIAARFESTVFRLTMHDYITSSRQQSAADNVGRDPVVYVDADVAAAIVAICGSQIGQHPSRTHFGMNSK